MELGYYSGPLRCNFPVAIITGACRSGKTLLTNAVATCPEAEASDEPWTPMMLPMMAGQGMIDEVLAQQWFSTNLCELMNDLVLLRRANFRPTDQSSIWSKKPAADILDRLSRLQSRVDVEKYMHDKRSTLLLTLAECSPFVDFMASAVPQARLIHVVRNGFDVAGEVEQKEWFSDSQLRLPRNAQLYRKNQKSDAGFYMPWWIPRDDFDLFLDLSQYERGMYYWCALMEPALRLCESLTAPNILVRYENLTRNPRVEFERVVSFLGFSEGKLTASQLATIQSQAAEVTCRSEIGPLYERVRELNDCIEERANAGQ